MIRWMLLPILVGVIVAIAVAMHWDHEWEPGTMRSMKVIRLPIQAGNCARYVGSELVPSECPDTYEAEASWTSGTVGDPSDVTICTSTGDCYHCSGKMCQHVERH